MYLARQFAMRVHALLDALESAAPADDDMDGGGLHVLTAKKAWLLLTALLRHGIHARWCVCIPNTPPNNIRRENTPKRLNRGGGSQKELLRGNWFSGKKG